MQVKAFSIIVITDYVIIVIKHYERRNKINYSYIKFYFMSMGAKFYLFKTNIMKSTKKKSILSFLVLCPEDCKSER